MSDISRPLLHEVRRQDQATQDAPVRRGLLHSANLLRLRMGQSSADRASSFEIAVASTPIGDEVGFARREKSIDVEHKSKCAFDYDWR